MSSDAVSVYGCNAIAQCLCVRVCVCVRAADARLDARSSSSSSLSLVQTLPHHFHHGEPGHGGPDPAGQPAAGRLQHHRPEL